ncbi:MAG: gliding motility-associated C-terminal domain-containing protein, partial [Bacteroidales bacterium]
ENGVCQIVTDTISLTINDLGFYTGFSPNGDDYNQFFVIDGIENTSENELVILNRWGVEVYRAENYDNENGWDGKDKNGIDLPDDTYYWILRVNKDLIYKGYVVLKRR